MELDDETESVTPLQKLEALAERVESEQGEHPKDLAKKLKKTLKSVKRLIAHGDARVKESFDEFMIRGHGGSHVEGINPMGNECTPERFWGEADSWIKTIWKLNDRSSDEEEEAKKTAVGEKAGLGQSQQAVTPPQAASAKRAVERTVRANRPEVSVKGGKGAKGGTAVGPGGLATAAWTARPASPAPGTGQKTRPTQGDGQPTEPTEAARRGVFNGGSVLPSGVSRKGLMKPNPRSQQMPDYLKDAAGMTEQDEQDAWEVEVEEEGDEGSLSDGKAEMQDSDSGKGSSEYSDSDEGEVVTRPSLLNRGGRGEQRGRNMDVSKIARDGGLMFYTITMEQAAESDVIRKNWREFRRKTRLNCIEVIKQVLLDEDSDEYKMMLALIHTVTEVETSAGTRKWRVGVVAAKDLAAFQKTLDGHRLNPSVPDGVMTADRTVWHVEGWPGYEMVIRLDQMGQQAGKLLGYFIGADSGLLGINGGDLDKASFISLQVAKALAAENWIPGIEHAQLQFRKATIDFSKGVSAYLVYSAFRDGSDRGIEEIMLDQLTLQGCRVRGSNTQFYIADKKEEAITAQRKEDVRRAPPIAAPLQLRREGHAGFVMGINPEFYLKPAELVRAFTRCCILKYLRDDSRFTKIFENAGTGSGFDPNKLQGISCADEAKAEKQLTDMGILPVYLAAETQGTRGALVAVTILVHNEGAVNEMVRSVLTYSSMWQEDGANAVAKPDRNYIYVPGAAGQGTRQGTATGAPMVHQDRGRIRAAPELRLQKAAREEMQLDLETPLQAEMQARLVAQEGRIDALCEKLDKVAEETKANTDEIKSSNTSIETKLDMLMAAILGAKDVKNKPEVGVGEV